MTTVEATVTDPAAANAAAYLPIAAVIAPTRSTLRRVEASRVSTTAHTSRSAPTVMPRVLTILIGSSVSPSMIANCGGQ